MAGKKGRSGGHNRKPTAELKLMGEYREDRHGDRIDEQIAVAGGRPPMPEGLSDYAQEVWIRTVDSKPEGVYTIDDVDMLRAYCNAAAAAVAAEGGDFREWKWAVQEMRAQAGRLGIGPVDRARLTIEKKEEAPADPLSAVKAM